MLFYVPFNWPPEQWLHLAYIANADGSMVLYINGRNVYSDAGIRPLTDGDTLHIGAKPSSNTLGNFYYGLVDDVQLFNRALSNSEIKHLHRGNAPILRLDFENEWVTDGMTLTDRSGWGNSLIMQSNDSLNKATSGIVGNRALRLDGVDDYLAKEKVSSLAAEGDFSFGGWVKPITEPISGTGTIMAFSQADGSQLNQLTYLYESNRFAYSDGQRSATLPQDAEREQWHHLFVSIKSTGETTLYLNASPIFTDTFALLPVEDGYWDIGRQRGSSGQGINYFAGSLDELIVYPYAVQPMEVWDLLQQGWQAAQVTDSTWSATVPEKMEGMYEINLRATDTVGNVSGHQSVWRGIIDNIAPRLISIPDSETGVTAMARSMLAASIDTRFEDFNLAETAFSTACGIGTISEQKFYEESWYLAFTDETATETQRLHQLQADCPQGSNWGYVNACDAYGNCTISAEMLPDLPTISISDVAVGEADGLAKFMISLSHAFAHDVQFEYATVDDTAVAGEDYTAVPTTTVTLPAGLAAVTVTVPITNDNAPESDDSFWMQLSNTINIGGGDYAGQALIINDDIPPTATPTATSTSTPTATPMSTPTATSTNTPTATFTNTPMATPTSTPMATPTSTPTATPTSTPTATQLIVPTSTQTPGNVPTTVSTAVPTITPTLMAEVTSTVNAPTVNAPTSTPTGTFTNEPTAVSTSTPTATQLIVPTSTQTPDNVPTEVPTITQALTLTPEVTPTINAPTVNAPTSTPTATVTIEPAEDAILMITGQEPNPSIPGEPITVSFTVSATNGSPSGSVIIGDGVDSCTGLLVNGSGQCTLTLTTTGERTLTARYGGAAGFRTYPSQTSQQVQSIEERNRYQFFLPLTQK